ncbi:D-2-hydroxyacid dehydrogenase [Macrococcus hajekii]|uniref:D-lactate dehydrogenase n=1 Tax=Macrococcus hajekii TaxID=198482 RepID=A0A4R6BJX8_9STAP|nr:D-2-hydroxyacid dehydrogenase [Macrococcus hajekii]TDM01940.1 D-2-hydroxyacid dehydrogenase [Macrococcus hajekii]GGB08713.1 D-lactate dehydrogenase [Macrococcus hajekii]
MTKIIMFNTREEERTAANEWAVRHNIDLTLSTETLNLNHLERLKNYQGISTSQTTPIDPAIYPALEKLGIRQIAQRSAGFDMFDLKLANKHHLIISNVPSYSPNSIAEFAVTTALQLVRKTAQIEKNIQNYDFRWNPALMSRSIKDLTVAVIGAGRIGQHTARIFNGFGSKVIAYDPVQNEELTRFVEYKDSLEEAVQTADIVSVHIPLTAENHHLFNEKLFTQFKKGSLFINAARGGIVNTHALLAAVNQGHLAGAALDTYENEGDYFKNDFRKEVIQDEMLKELIRHDKIIITPHIAFFTDVAVQNLVEGGLDSVLQVINTGTCDNRVN